MIVWLVRVYIEVVANPPFQYSFKKFGLSQAKLLNANLVRVRIADWFGNSGPGKAESRARVRILTRLIISSWHDILTIRNIQNKTPNRPNNETKNQSFVAEQDDEGLEKV